jgi:hypothetical protein
LVVCTSTALSVGTTPSAPTENPINLLEVRVTRDDVVAQKTMLPLESTGAISNVPFVPVRAPPAPSPRMVTSTGVVMPLMRAQTWAGSTHSVVRVYARKASGWLSFVSRISQSVSPPVLVQRKRGRSQLRGKSAPG